MFIKSSTPKQLHIIGVNVIIRSCVTCSISNLQAEQVNIALFIFMGSVHTSPKEKNMTQFIPFSYICYVFMFG